MQPRISAAKVSPEAFRALLGVQAYVDNSSLELPLRELIKVRVSQINGCAYCIDMHTKEARAHGETEQRLYGLNAWRETPYYTERERAALAFAEAVTLISRDQVPDDIYEQTRVHFSEAEIVDLTMTVIAINSWNRAAITFRTPAGSYQVPSAKKAG